MNNKSYLWSAVGGLVIGVGRAMVWATFSEVKVAFNASLLGLGVALISLGLVFWDKVKKWT